MIWRGLFAYGFNSRLKKHSSQPPFWNGLENIRLIPQPAYSPELNPVEHIWDELREKYFYNHIFSSLDQLVDVLCYGLNALADDTERLRSLTGFPHLKVTF